MKRSLKGGAAGRFKLPEFSFELSWKKIAVYALGFLVVASLYLISLASLPGGYSRQEALSAVSSSSLGAIWDNPVNLPHKILSYVYGFATNDLLATRLSSATFAIIGAILFFVIVRKWHTNAVAFWISALFITSAAMLHLGRWGVGAIVASTLLLAFLSIGLFTKYRVENTNKFLLLTLAVLLSLSLYVPGMLWIVLALVIIGRKTILEFVGRYPAILKTGSILLFLILLIPLGWFVVQNPIHNLLVISGLENHPASIIDGLRNIGTVPLHVLYGGYSNSELWLARIALLDAFVAIMALLGGYYYIYRYRKLARSPILIVLLLLSGLLVAASNYLLLPVLMVILYLFAAGGLSEMRGRWFVVFPRNPLAQNIGIVMISIVVGLSIFYNLRHYFVAWPASPETKQVYVIQPER